MRRAIALVGNLMIALAIAGFVFIGSVGLDQLAPDQPVQQADAKVAVHVPPRNPSLRASQTEETAPQAPEPAAEGKDVVPLDLPVRGDAPVDLTPTDRAPPDAGRAPARNAQGSAPPAVSNSTITRVQIPKIGLDSRVALAKYVAAGGGTWNIPPYIVGHAEYTAGAGETGNALLFGHVTSISVGNVFQELDKVDLGDEIEVYSGAAEHRYRVVDVRAVSRDDVSVLQPTVRPSVSLITCTGNWLPLERDYDQRLIVRAELVPVSA